MKLIVEEPESERLPTALAGAPRQIASVVVEVEVARAVRRAAPDLTRAAERVLAQLDVVEPGEIVRARAATLPPPELRTLDAIHLATALEAQDELDAFVTYDGRLAVAAAAAGLAVVSPGHERP